MPYNVILADPPWKFSTYSSKGEKKSAQSKYDCMTIDDICSLPVADHASDNCALFIWTTWPFIFETQKVIDAWGFKYSGLAWEWLKYNDKTNKFAFGCGYGTRKNVEPCLLARKGSPILKSKSVRDFIMAPRREHSRKPDQTYENIEAMYDGPYLELFSRTNRNNWDVEFSNQAGTF